MRPWIIRIWFQYHPLPLLSRLVASPNITMTTDTDKFLGIRRQNPIGTNAIQWKTIAKFV